MRRCSRAAPAGTGAARWPAAATWYLLYTSGTTGRPKGVIYTYRMALANYVNIGAAHRPRLDRHDARASCPLFHTAGINLHALPTLIAGGRVIVLDGFDAEALVALLEARRLDTFFARADRLSEPARPSALRRRAARPCPPLGLRRRAAARRARASATATSASASATAWA